MTSPAAPEKDRQTAVAPGAGEPEPWGWTRTQRIGLGTLLFLLLCILVVQWIRRPEALDDHLVVLQGRRVTLPTRMDVNTATAEELARIPHLGEKLAANIVAYREARKGLTPDGLVFHQPEDLEKVPRVGKSLVQAIAGYLHFPDAATEPSP